mmetsp:Transcript_22059/g.45983  ORF Transcript_22059/g.45983 Transcript_22059/m.45983 type:complete len:246 (-) Transcript_22059:1540-2277(-)
MQALHVHFLHSFYVENRLRGAYQSVFQRQIDRACDTFLTRTRATTGETAREVLFGVLFLQAYRTSMREGHQKTGLDLGYCLVGKEGGYWSWLRIWTVGKGDFSRKKPWTKKREEDKNMRLQSNSNINNVSIMNNNNSWATAINKCIRIGIKCRRQCTIHLNTGKSLWVLVAGSLDLCFARVRVCVFWFFGRRAGGRPGTLSCFGFFWARFFVAEMSFVSLRYCSDLWARGCVIGTLSQRVPRRTL